MAVNDISDADLVRRAVMNARGNVGEFLVQPIFRWVAVKHTFGLGSTYARELCLRFNLDPDEMIITGMPGLKAPDWPRQNGNEHE